MYKIVIKVKILSVISFFIFSCQTEQKKLLNEAEPQLIETKALIKNQSESNNVKIEIALLPSKAIRMEITASFGISVATILMSESKIQYALHSSKQFVTGPFHEKTLYPVFKKNIDPRVLWKIIHNQNPANSKLNCVINDNKQPVSCKGDYESEISWTYEEPPQRRVKIMAPKFELVWLFKDISPLYASQNETFVLKKPSDYKEIIIK